MTISKCTTYRGYMRNVWQFWLGKENCSFGFKLWQMNDRIYLYPLGRTRCVDLVLSYHLKDSPLFKKSKFYTNMQIYDDRVIFLGITELFSQSHVLWNVRVNSSCFQRCFFYRKRHFKWNFKNWNITFFWNFTRIYTLWKQKHKFAWNVPKFKIRARFTKLFLMPSPWANFVLSFSKKSSFPQNQLPRILMKPALSKVYTHWLLVASSCQNIPTKNSSEFVESE